MSTRDAFRQHLTRGDVEGALLLVEDELPGKPDSSTRKNNLSGARAVLRWAQDEWRSVLHPDAAFGAAYLAHLLARYQDESASVQNRLTHARNLFRAMQRRGVCETNPFEGLRGPTHHAERHRTGYDDAEVTRLVRHADVEGKALILCGAHGGLTGPEVRVLTWARVDLAGEVLRLPGRNVPMSVELRAALASLAQQRGVGLFPSTSPLFALEDQAALRRRMFALCQQANVWYGERGWRALRAHAGRRFWLAYQDLDRVAAVLGLHGQRVPYVVRGFALKER